MERAEEQSGAGEPAREERVDFFISYATADKLWAEWIAWCLEQASYRVRIAAWDFRPGSNFVLEMDRALKEAERMIAVLSPAYLDSGFASAEWAVIFGRDPQGRECRVVPVQVQPCDVKGLLASIVHIDLIGVSDPEARKRLLAGVKQQLPHPTSVGYPGLPHLIPERPAFPGALPVLWNVPYLRNPLFTGREDLLAQLASALHSGQITALSQPQAISGLGGIGKTQLAVEYAYQHAQDYEAVLWSLADSHEALVSGYVALAGLLRLPERDEQDQMKAVEAVKRWLRMHTKWLLILDNVDEPGLLRDFLPQGGSGHVLLTTRAQALGGRAQRIEVEVMDEEQGVLFLLRRTGLLKANDTLAQAGADDIAVAKVLVRELGGLPLALDQAGAYIEEVGCSLEDYRSRYQSARKALLQRRGGALPDHPESVTVTFLLAFEKVERKNPAAADLLRLCACLAPDAIPEEIITQGAEHLGPNLEDVKKDPLLLDEAIAALRAYSLLRRDAMGKTLSLHRLVQAVLKDAMDQPTYREWAERAVRVVSAVFPTPGEFANWPLCERLLPHAQACAELIEQEQLMLLEAARLLNQAGYYLDDRGRYAEAEPLYKRGLLIYEQQQGPEHSDTATSLNNLALLYQEQGRYEEVEPLYKRALLICERQLGAEHPDTAISLDNLASLYWAQGKYAQAEPLYKRALLIHEQQLGAEHPHTATSLNNLALLYHVQGKYEQAEPLFERALAISEQQLGPEHPATATSLNNLALLYYKQGKYEQAEPLYQRALLIWEQQLEVEHPYTARSLNNLAELYRVQGKYEQAVPLYKRALAICEKQLGPEHPDTARSLNNLANLYHDQGKYEQAEPLYKRALAIWERVLGGQHPHTMIARKNYMALLCKMGREQEAREVEARVQQKGQQSDASEE